MPSGTSTLTPSTTSVSELTVRPTAVECCCLLYTSIAAEGDDALALRVAVRPGGCSGFSYEMFFDSETDAEDVSEAYGAIKVVSDPSSAQLLDGATLDYKDGLESGFAITTVSYTHLDVYKRQIYARCSPTRTTILAPP